MTRKGLWKLAQLFFLSTICLGYPFGSNDYRSLGVQTPDLPGPGDGKLTTKEALQGLDALSTLIDLDKFPQTTSVQDALLAAYRQLAKQGKEFFYVLDSAYLKDAPPQRFFEAKMKIAHLPRRITVAALLHEVLRQTCSKSGVLIIRPGSYVEITSLQSALRHNFRGFWLMGSIGFGDAR